MENLDQKLTKQPQAEQQEPAKGEKESASFDDLLELANEVESEIAR